MLHIQPNSRQIPHHEEYAGDKRYSDIVYAYLQSISLPGRDEHRLVNAKDITATKVAEACGITRQTASKRLKGLRELWLVGDREGSQIPIYYLPQEYAKLVPMDVLNVLIDEYQSHIISLYVWAIWVYFMNNQQGFTFTSTGVKKHIGISSKTYGNSSIINDGLEKLESLGLLKYRANVINEDGTGFKTVQTIYWVSNKIDFVPPAHEEERHVQYIF